VAAGRQAGKSGGRHAQHGAGLLVRRIEGGFAASWLGPAFFVWAEGPTAERPHDRAAMAASFANGGVEFVRCLRWREPADPGRSWFIDADWSLGYDEPASA
jgi:protein-L-isoaspartate(D-aspartate) O-methyltransferase